MNEFHGKTLLLVEDESIIAFYEKHLFEAEGYSVVHAESGEEAVAYINANPEKISLILMDIDLGTGMDGAETARQILSTHDIPVLFLSSHTEKEIVEKTENITSYGYVVKNSGEVILLAAIKMAFRLNEARRKENEKEMKLLLQHRRLESMVKILQNDSEDIQEFLDFTLDEAIKLTDSKIGYIYYYDEDRKEFILNSWSKEVMHQCTINEKQTRYQLDKTGIWGEVVRQRGPVILNHFQSPHPLKKGYPEGHAHLERFMSVPVFFRNRIVAVVGVANRETDYNQTDVLQLTLLMDAVWKKTEHLQLINNLTKSEEKFQKVFQNSPIPMSINDMANCNSFEDCNAAFEKETGYTRSEIIGKHPGDLGLYAEPEERKKILELFEQTGKVSNYEYKFRNRDGQVSNRFLSLIKIEVNQKPHLLIFQTRI